MSDQDTIWYINHYAGGPGLGRAYRPYLLAKELHKQGVHLEVITASFHHLIQDQTPHYQAPKRFDKEVCFRFLATPQYSGNGMGRLKNSLAFAWRLLGLQPNKAKPKAIVYSSPHLFGILSAWILAKRYKAKLILEVRDIWPLSLVEIAGVAKNHPIVKVFSWIEWLAYRLVDHRVALLKGADKHFNKVCKTPKPFTWIPNGADLTLHKADALPDPVQSCINQYQEQGFLVLGYAGALGEPNAMAQFVDAMAKLKQHKVALLLIGEGGLKAELISQTKELGIEHVHFFEPVSKEQALRFVSEVDATVIGWQDKPIYQYGISPNKIFDYMLCKKPVIHACSSPFDPIADAGAGISVAAGDSTAIAAAISELLAADAEKRADFGNKGYAYLTEHHDIVKLAAKYKGIFNL